MLPRPIAAVLLAATALAPLPGQSRPRARDLGIPFDGTPGPLNAITDVAGVEVGQVTIVRGSGRLVVGQGPVRTGVTAIFPRGKASPDPAFASWFALNGNGEMTGTTWLEESGFLWGPVAITNTLSVGQVRDAVIAWAAAHRYDAFLWALPVVAETWDGPLNDITGFHVTRADAFRALDAAGPGPVAEGNVGGGTGMICHEFKGGIGTASRALGRTDGGYTLGVLVQCNYGLRRRLSIAGVPVGAEVGGVEACRTIADPSGDEGKHLPRCGAAPSGTARPSGSAERGSIIIVIATDAPLLPHQLRRVAKRAALGIGRMGGLGGDSSGDIFLAFSTANPGAARDTGTAGLTMLPNDRMDPIFEATVGAVEEAIVNALVAAETMTGADGVRIFALPQDQLLASLRRHDRIR